MKSFKKFIKYTLMVVFMVACLTCIAIPAIHWFKHPELTEMQVFLMFWKTYITGIVFYFVFYYISNIDLKWE